jgi:2-succinyl-5-enolpyruvyl-6-hydroxy-3-cyclohexene-1-carboxylate synthase
VVPDERAAAFMALGMAQQLGGPVGLVCTSGTAVLNYAPAVAEAFYQQVPLLVLTADRPPEWIEQQDGQTLNQREVYGKHVKASYQLPTDYVHPDAEWQAERILNEAINLAGQYPKGPVHINVPLREPLYPAPGEKLTFGPVRLIEQWPAQAVLSPVQWVALREMWEDSDRKLVVAGQHAHSAELIAVLRQIQSEMHIPVVGDVISNLHPLPDACRYADSLLMRQDEAWRESLRPDLLVTFGNSVISKNLKLFLRRHKPAFHWHLQPAGPVADAFQTLTHVLRVEPLYFFRTLFADLDYQHFLQDDEEDANPEYYQGWRQGDQDAARRLGKLFREAPFGEFEAVAECLEALPDDSVLHLANSMSVRYANFAGCSPASGWRCSPTAAPAASTGARPRPWAPPCKPSGS